MNLPNRLSLLRVALLPLILIALFAGGPVPENPLLAGYHRLFALILLIIATVTDFVDGYIARKYKLETNLGKLLDPLADKLLVAASFVAFVELNLFPAWLIIIILCREFLVTGLRSLAAIKGVVMAADKWGKHKTTWQMITIILTMIFLTVREFGRAYGYWEGEIWNMSLDQFSLLFLNILLYFTTALTIVSGYVYMSKNRELLRED